MVDLAGAEQPLGLCMVHDQVLEHALRQPGLSERLGEALADEQRLRGMLQDHGAAGDQRRHDRVDGGEVGIVPGRDHHDHAEGLARHVAAEARLRVARIDGLQRFFRDVDHVFRALDDAALLAAVAHRAPHLPGEFGHDLVVHGKKRVEEGQRITASLGDRHQRPLCLRGLGALDRGVDGLVRGDRSLGIGRAVDGGFDLDGVHRRVSASACLTCQGSNVAARSVGQDGPVAGNEHHVEYARAGHENPINGILLGFSGQIRRADQNFGRQNAQFRLETGKESVEEIKRRGRQEKPSLRNPNAHLPGRHRAYVKAAIKGRLRYLTIRLRLDWRIVRDVDHRAGVQKQ